MSQRLKKKSFIKVLTILQIKSLFLFTPFKPFKPFNLKIHLVLKMSAYFYQLNYTPKHTFLYLSYLCFFTFFTYFGEKLKHVDWVLKSPSSNNCSPEWVNKKTTRLCSKLNLPLLFLFLSFSIFLVISTCIYILYTF